MLYICLALFVNMSGEKIAVNINKISAIEAESNSSKIYLDTFSLKTTVPLSMKDVLEKIAKAKEECSK